MTILMQSQRKLPELDYRVLDRELDRVKTKVFLGKNAGFLGPLMCSLDFHWAPELDTAATNGEWIKWNPYYFHYLHPAGRQSILVHELWHVGLMHMLRRGTRIPEIWNAACDTVLDNMMDIDGYDVSEKIFPVELFPAGSKSFVNHAKYGTMSAEEIYDDMIKNQVQMPSNMGFGFAGSGNSAGKTGKGDLVEPDQANGTTTHNVVNKVMGAFHAAKLGGGAGNLPGELEVTLKKFLSPKLPWNRILHNFFNDLANQDYSWCRPNRRYQDIYLPSMIDDHEGLEHLAYYLDVSGSITDGDIIRFHSEFKHVKETYQPEKMTMVQFDTRIQKVDVFDKDDPFEETHVIGRGGTAWAPVREHIIETRPTAAVIFTDMGFNDALTPLPPGHEIPIIWVALNNRGATVPHGQIVHLNE